MVHRHLRAAVFASALFASGLAASGALGQNNSQAAKADGKAFASEIAKQAQAASKRAPTADSVPNFSPSPPNADLFADPDAMPSRAAAAASHDGYSTVRSSLDQRPLISIPDIETTIARGSTIADDPMPYVSGMGIGGGQGACRALPPATASAGYYEATCNVGVSLQQATESCAIALDVTFEERSAYLYYAEDPVHTGLAPGMQQFAPAIASGQCRVEGTADSCAVVRAYGLRPNSRCANFLTRIVRCSGEPAGLSGTTVPATGQLWYERQVERVAVTSRNESACAGLAGDASCVAEPESCTSSNPVTRLVDGVAVTRPCWAWTRTYHCNRVSPAQDCGDLEANPACSFVREGCLTNENPCPTVERIYRCPMPPTPSSEQQYICDGDIYCIGGECETIAREPNTEFRDAAVALNAAAQAGREFDPNNLSLFKGTRETCHKRVFGLLNCCRGKAFPLLPGASLLVALGCSREEVLLHTRDAQGLCAHVGSYCSDSVLGVCVTSKKVYCCFESKLSRILQEQGRAQLGKPWDRPRREQCRGFTIDEFARLDLSKMDFSEVYAEFQDAATLPEELSTVSAMQQKIADYYVIHGGGR